MVELFFKILPVEKLPAWLRTTFLLGIAGFLIYWAGVYALRGADAMHWTVPHVAFLALAGAVGVAAGELAWLSKDAVAKSASASPQRTLPAPSISQNTTGAQSPNVVGDHATITYHNALPPSGPTPDEVKYRGQLADEIGGLRHSLDKSRNCWYAYSLEGDPSKAGEARRESEKRMGESAALLRSKVNRTAEAEFLQIQAGEPIAHPNLLRSNLPDGAAISEMWNRATRLQKIEQRVRNGAEPIVYPPIPQ